ncbi:hypothetical protein D3C71_1853010 [compost metagenome]
MARLHTRALLQLLMFMVPAPVGGVTEVFRQVQFLTKGMFEKYNGGGATVVVAAA